MTVIFIILATEGNSLCSKYKVSKIPTGTYIMVDSQESVKQSLTLDKDNGFLFSYSLQCSYLPRGKYSVRSNKLVLRNDDTADDKTISFVFEMKKGESIFNEKESTSIPSFAGIYDRAVFMRH